MGVIGNGQTYDMASAPRAVTGRQTNQHDRVGVRGKRRQLGDAADTTCLLVILPCPLGRLSDNTSI
jgi:hypothetical protein